MTKINSVGWHTYHHLLHAFDRRIHSSSSNGPFKFLQPLLLPRMSTQGLKHFYLRQTGLSQSPTHDLPHGLVHHGPVAHHVRVDRHVVTLDILLVLGWFLVVLGAILGRHDPPNGLDLLVRAGVVQLPSQDAHA